MRIMEHDIQYKTEYTKTLEKYVSSVGNLTEAARSMHIHYNTMKYRMEKISYFFEDCEINTQRRMLLFLSFRILELLDHAIYHHCLAGSEGANI
jgi:DNA-binding PucR family transcriptional regulator